jgi:carbon-monoxide dehydrogenase large subunit
MRWRRLFSKKGRLCLVGTADRHETYPSGAHVAEIEIDPATGEITVVRYTAVDDCGTVLSEQLAEAQIQGGIVQGLGEALGEMAAFDDSGQLLSASFMDYRMPGRWMSPTSRWNSEAARRHAMSWASRGSAKLV